MTSGSAPASSPPDGPAARLGESERRFIARRRSLATRWPLVGGGLLLAIAGVVAYLAVRSPLLVNPWEVTTLLKAERIPAPMLAEMAAKLPVVFLVCCGLLTALVLFQLASVGAERRLLRTIDRLLEDAEDDRRSAVRDDDPPPPDAGNAG